VGKATKLEGLFHVSSCGEGPLRRATDPFTTFSGWGVAAGSGRNVVPTAVDTREQLLLSSEDPFAEADCVILVVLDEVDLAPFSNHFSDYRPLFLQGN